MNSIDPHADATTAQPAPRHRRTRAPTPASGPADATPAPSPAPPAPAEATPAAPPPRLTLVQRLRQFGLLALNGHAPAGHPAAPSAPSAAAPDATPSAAETAMRDARPTQLALPLPDVATPAAFALPDALQKRYLVGADNKYYFRDRDQALAFEDLGHRLRTAHDDPDVAASMVELARAKGWSRIRVRGSAAFKHAAWLAAAERGLEVSGHRPDARDKARLAERLAQHEQQTREQHPANQIERQEALPATPATPAKARPRRKRAATTRAPAATSADAPAAPTPTPVPEQQHDLGPQQRRAVERLRSFLRQRGDSEAAIALTVDVAAGALSQRRSHFGQLLAHAPAPYQYDPENDMSYFATLLTDRGEQTIWGVDLERALADSGATIGDGVALIQPDHRPVTVSGRELDGDGKPTGRRVPIGADRNRWEVISLDNARDFAAQTVAPALARTVAPARTPQHTREGPAARER